MRILLVEDEPRAAPIVENRQRHSAASRAGLWIRTFLALLAVVGFTSGCQGKEPVSRSIAASAEKGSGTRFVLTEHTGFPWDKVCILGPYTPDDKVDSLTGIPGAARQAHDIRSNDGINVLMFVREARIAASVAHPRNQGDFGPEVVGKCYSREQAHFSVRVPPANSWGNIGPPHFFQP
jgi:hypothetical protein